MRLPFGDSYQSSWMITNRKKCLEGHHFGVIFGCFENGGNMGEWWYPATMGFPTKNDHFGVWNGGTAIYGNTQIQVLKALRLSWGPSMSFYTKTTPENNIPSKNAGHSRVGGFKPFYSQIGSFHQIGMKIKNSWNHHLVPVFSSHPAFTGGDGRQNFSHHKRRTRNFNELILYQKWMVFLEHGSRSGFKYVHFLVSIRRISGRYCWWKKSCTRWYWKYPIIYMVLYIPGGCLDFFHQQYH